MVIIGINGDVGAGKSSLSENLFLGTDRVVVHLDHIFDRIIAMMPKALMPSVKREDGEELRIASMDSPIRKITSNKYVSQIMWLYARKTLEGLIKKYEKAGYEYFIIDGIYLEKCINLEDLDYRIYVNAPVDTRYNRVINRNTEEEIAVRGNNAVEDNGIHQENYDFTIYNSGSYEQFLDNIKETECAMLSQTFKRSKTNK